MAGRIRSIKPEILEDERSAGLSSDAWRLWVSMWLLADDHGNLRGTPEWLRSQVFWARESRESLAKLLEELASARVIVRYEVDGQRYIAIRNWDKHQRVDHPGKPRVPGPPEGVTDTCAESSRESRETLANIPESLAPDLRPRPRSPNTIAPSERPSFDLLALYAMYPRKRGKAPGLKKLKTAIKTAEDYEAVKAGIVRMVAEAKRAGTETEYLPYFSTWVSERRWEDGEVPGSVDSKPRRYVDGYRDWSVP